MNMKLYPIVISVLFFAGCSSTSYYQSPLHANTNGYKSIPLQRDSTSNAIYGTAMISGGAANDNLRDGLRGFTVELHRAHNLGRFQAYYGITGTTGRYRVDSTHNEKGGYFNRALDTALINSNTGSKRFSSLGGFAAVNYVLPTSFGEWRVAGVELAWQREFGDYLKFRRMLPDTASNMIDKRKSFFTVGVSTDVLFATNNGSFGLKFAFITNPTGVNGYDVDRNVYQYTSSHFASTIHAEFNRFNAFTQLNIGDHAVTFIGGGGYRLR